MTLYFPTKEEYDKVLREAHNATISFNKFCIEMIRRGMEQPAMPCTDLQDTREELARLNRELKEKNARIEQLETDLFTARHAPFLQPIPEGRGQLSSELVDLLQDGHTWRPDEIMHQLGIDSRNIDAITALAGQLHALQDLKLVVEAKHGWRWIG